MPDRDAALGAADFRLCHHRAQRRAVGIERPDGRSQQPARVRRTSGRTCNGLGWSSRGRRARRFARARASKFPCGSPARPSCRTARSSPGASRDESGEAALGPEPTTIALDRRRRGRDRHRSARTRGARRRRARVLSRNALEFCVVPPLAARRRRCSRSTARPREAARRDRLAEPRRDADERGVVLATRLTTPVREVAHRRPQGCC